LEERDSHCNTLQHTATHCNTLQHTATHCNTLQRTATHCNTLQHITTLCNTLHEGMFRRFRRDSEERDSAAHCNVARQIATFRSANTQSQHSLASIHNSLGCTLIHHPTSQAVLTSPTTHEHAFVCFPCAGSTQVRTSLAAPLELTSWRFWFVLSIVGVSVSVYL